ncbi:hypothetical protein AAG906_021103 [Vitis piasezkii]
MDEPESSTSENAMVNITQPYHLGCELTFLDDEIGFLDYLSCGSSCQCDHNDGVSESVWVTYYSNVAIKHRYRSDKPRFLKASFRGHVNGKPVKVEQCGIGLVHVDQKPLKAWYNLRFYQKPLKDCHDNIIAEWLEAVPKDMQWDELMSECESLKEKQLLKRHGMVYLY